MPRPFQQHPASAARDGLIAALAGLKPPPLPLEPTPSDLDALADYVRGAAEAFALFVGVLGRDLAANSRRRVDVEALRTGVLAAVDDELISVCRDAADDAREDADERAYQAARVRGGRHVFA